MTMRLAKGYTSSIGAYSIMFNAVAINAITMNGDAVRKKTDKSVSFGIFAFNYGAPIRKQDVSTSDFFHYSLFVFHFSSLIIHPSIVITMNGDAVRKKTDKSVSF